MTNRVECISTIYDSIYFLIDDDIDTIKWLNDYLIPIMTKDFMEDQIVKNTAVAEIGYDWANLHKIPNEATLAEIKVVLDNIKDANAKTDA